MLVQEGRFILVGHYLVLVGQDGEPRIANPEYHRDRWHTRKEFEESFLKLPGMEKIMHIFDMADRYLREEDHG